MAEYSNLKQAVEAYQAGDSDAFRYIYDETNNNLYVYARYIMKDESRAEELLQDTYLEIIKSIGNLKDPGAFTTWSKQIMFNLSRHAFEKSAREQQNTISRGDDDEEIQIADLDRDYTPEERADANFVNRIVRDAIDRLPAEMSFVLVSHYMDGLKIREIAEITGDSENTIKSRLRLGRNKVKAMLEKYEKETDTKLLVAAPASLIATALRSIGADPSFLLPEGAGSTMFTHLAKAVSDAASAAGAAGSAGTGGAAGASGTAAGTAGTAGTGGAAGAGTAATAGEAGGISASSAAGAIGTGAAGAGAAVAGGAETGAGAAAGEAAGAAAGSSAAKAAAGAAAAKAVKGGLAKKITALIIAACVGVGGGTAVMHHVNNAAESDVSEKEMDVRTAYSDYFHDFFDMDRENEHLINSYNARNESREQITTMHQLFVGDHNKDKLPEFIYFESVESYMGIMAEEYNDYGYASFDYYNEMDPDSYLAVYKAGTVKEINISDTLEDLQEYTMSDEIDNSPYTSNFDKVIIYMSDDGDEISFVHNFISQGVEEQQHSSVYCAAKYKYKDGEYVLEDAHPDRIREGDTGFEEFKKVFMPENFTRTSRTMSFATSFYTYNTYDNYEGLDYLMKYGIDARESKKYKDWKTAYKDYFKTYSNIYPGDYIFVAHDDINEDGVPEVFVASGDLGADFSDVDCFSFCNGRIVHIGHGVDSSIDLFGLSEDGKKIKIRGVGLFDGNHVDKYYEYSLDDAGFKLDSMLEAMQSDSEDDEVDYVLAFKNFKKIESVDKRNEIADEIYKKDESDFKKLKWSKAMNSKATYKYICKNIIK